MVITVLCRPAAADDQQTFDAEARVMFWADQCEPQSLANQDEDVKGHDRKVQADYTRKRESPEIDNNELRLSVILVF